MHLLPRICAYSLFGQTGIGGAETAGFQFHSLWPGRNKEPRVADSIIPLREVRKPNSGKY